MVVTRLCEPSGGRRSPYPERKKSTEVIQMSGFDFEEDGLESMEDEALKQAEMVQKIVSGWKLIEFDEGEPIWHRGRQLSPMVSILLCCVLFLFCLCIDLVLIF